MAQTQYKSVVAITTTALRAAAYDGLRVLFGHLDRLNLNLVSLTVDVNNFLIVTLNNPLPIDQVTHLELTGPI